MTFTDETIPQATAALARLDSTLLRLATEARPGSDAGPVAARAGWPRACPIGSFTPPLACRYLNGVS